MMKISDYELLIQLAEIGTVRGTAKAILISQPAVSQRLKYIEQYFDEQIFIRTSKRLQLTPSGELILAHAKEVISRELEIKNKLAASSKEVRGTLSIACSTVISQRYLPKILAKFMQNYPKVTIDLVTGTSSDIKEDFVNYHVSIVRGDKIKDLESTLLFEDPLYIFDTEPITKGEVKKRPLISFKSDDGLEEVINNWMANQNKIEPIQQISVDQIETCKQFMKQGLGMAVLPWSVSESLMEKYFHIPLEIDGKKIGRKTWLCYQPEFKNLPQVNSFIKLMLEESFI
jgi:DNA-binding transcriptional LysR family regulator